MSTAVVCMWKSLHLPCWKTINVTILKPILPKVGATIEYNHSDYLLVRGGRSCAAVKITLLAVSGWLLGVWWGYGMGLGRDPYTVLLLYRAARPIKRSGDISGSMRPNDHHCCLRRPVRQCPPDTPHTVHIHLCPFTVSIHRGSPKQLH